MRKDKKKIKLLFVLENLRKAGAQKYLFEIIMLLNKENFEIQILCGLATKIKDDKLKQEYYQIYKDMGMELYPLIGSREAGMLLIPFSFTSQLYRLSVFGKLFIKLNRLLNPYLYKLLYGKKVKEVIKQADKIIAVDFYTYNIVKPHLTNKEKTTKLDIHLLCHAKQFPNMYQSFEKNLSFNFFYFDSQQRDEAIQAGLGNSCFRYQPLLLSTGSIGQAYRELPKGKEIIHIGVFTRLSGFDKPIDVFILAFHSLIVANKKINAQLDIIGENTLDEKYVNHLKNLIRFHDIEDKVKFHGHQSNLVLFLEQNEIHLSWQHSIGSTLGYASLELIALGIPVCAFSFYNTGKIESNNYMAFNIPDFINLNLEILNDEQKRKNHYKNQVKFLQENHNSSLFDDFWNNYFSQQSINKCI